MKLCPCSAAVRLGPEESQAGKLKSCHGADHFGLERGGSACGEETKETQRRRRKDREKLRTITRGDKGEGRAGGRGDCVIACVWVRLYGGAARHVGGPAGAPIW